VLLFCRDTDITEVDILLSLATDNTVILNTPISKDTLVDASQHLGAAFNLFFIKIKGNADSRMVVVKCLFIPVVLVLLDIT
jgi:hypothetical protein